MQPVRLLPRVLPEILLGALFLFFALRELGTFPAAWEDDGLFMTVARNLAEGWGFVLPVLDAAWVIFKRLVFGASPFVGDKRHLHFQLLDIGLTQRQAVMLLYFFAAVFGGVAVFLAGVAVCGSAGRR